MYNSDDLQNNINSSILAKRFLIRNNILNIDCIRDIATSNKYRFMFNTIEVLSTIKSVDETTIGYKASSNVKATFYDANGNPLIYRTITVKYDDKNMNFKTNEKKRNQKEARGTCNSHG